MFGGLLVLGGGTVLMIVLLKTNQTLIKFKNLDSSYYYTVRCSWLKSPVSEPQFLDTCEGKQLQKSENS